MTAADDPYVDAIVAVAERDPSIARMLRTMCALDPDVRARALALVGAHLRAQAAAPDVLECVDALGRDEVARRLRARLGSPGGGPG